MPFLYNIGIRAFGLGIGLAAPFNRKAKLLCRGRKGLLQSIEAKTTQFPKGKKSIWIHCASLGEFEQGRPLIEALRQKYPDKNSPDYRPIVVTFFSPSGYEARKDYDQADAVFYLPGDTPKNAERFIRAINPEMVLFIKYEYWYNYLKTLNSGNIPSYIVSALFRPDMVFFKRGAMGNFMRKTLGLVRHFFVQNEDSKELLASIGITDSRVTVSGDTRFDRVTEVSTQRPDMPIAEAFTRNSWPLVCGSTWPQDEELLLELMQEAPDVKFIIAPHEIYEERIKKLIRQSGRQTVRYTELENLPTDEAKRLAEQAGLLIIDTIGILSKIYRFGKAAYIGGGFGREGIHNALEAAAWGIPILSGPNYQDFAEAVELVGLGAAFPIQDAGELKKALQKLTKDEDFRSTKGATAESYVKSRAGATKTVLSRILQPDNLS